MFNFKVKNKFKIIKCNSLKLNKKLKIFKNMIYEQEFYKIVYNDF